MKTKLTENEVMGNEALTLCRCDNCHHIFIAEHSDRYVGDCEVCTSPDVSEDELDLEEIMAMEIMRDGK